MTASDPGPAGGPAGPGGVRGVPRRRSPALVAAGVALIGLGAAAGLWAVQTKGAAAEIAVYRDVAYGAQITVDDLQVVKIPHVAGLVVIPADQVEEVVGRYAQVELKAGTLLTPAQLGGPVAPGPGQYLVGLSLQPNQRPQRPIVAGAQVLLVMTRDNPGSDPTTPAGDVVPPATVKGQVLDVSPPDDQGNVVVDVIVATTDGPGLANVAAAGDVALLLAPATGQ